MGNPLVGARFISRGALRDMVRESYAYDRELNERKANAVHEFNDRTKGVTDNRRRFLILKEVAAKYHFREDWFVKQVRL